MQLGLGQIELHGPNGHRSLEANAKLPWILAKRVVQIGSKGYSTVTKLQCELNVALAPEFIIGTCGHKVGFR